MGRGVGGLTGEGIRTPYHSFYDPAAGDDPAADCTTLPINATDEPTIDSFHTGHPPNNPRTHSGGWPDRSPGRDEHVTQLLFSKGRPGASTTRGPVERHRRVDGAAARARTTCRGPHAGHTPTGLGPVWPADMHCNPVSPP